MGNFGSIGMGMMLAREGAVLTGQNGQVNPALSIPSWRPAGGCRIVNDSNARFWRLGPGKDHPFHLIATDARCLRTPVAARGVAAGLPARGLRCGAG